MAEDLIGRWLKKTNAMFGDVVEANCGHFDADLEETPPFVDRIPADHSWECFVFEEIYELNCKNKRECEIKLIYKLEDSINSQMTLPRDTSKATLVWRIRPKIGPYEENWYGYARMKILDKNSVYQNYLTESDKRLAAFQDADRRASA